MREIRTSGLMRGRHKRSLAMRLSSRSCLPTLLFYSIYIYEQFWPKPVLALKNAKTGGSGTF